MKTIHLIILLATSTLACNEVKPEREPVAPLATRTPVAELGHGAKKAKPATTSLSKEDAALVVAKVGETEITLGEIDLQLAEQPVYVRARYNTLEKKKEFLDNLVRFELLVQEAERKGYDKDPDVVFAMKQQMAKKLMERDLEKLVSMQDVSMEEVRSFYDTNKQLYFKPEAVRTTQIVFSNGEKANRIRDELAKSFEDEPRKKRQLFSKAVDTYTEDPIGRAKRGDVGFFTEDGRSPETLKPLEEGPSGAVRKAAFALEKINDLSPVVSDGQRFVVMLLTNRRPEVSKTLADVKQQIRNKLFRDKRDQARQDYIADLKVKADVKVYEDRLARLKDKAAQVEFPGSEAAKRMRKDAESKGIVQPAAKKVPEQPEGANP